MLVYGSQTTVVFSLALLGALMIFSFVDSQVELMRWLEEDTKNIPLEAGSPTSMNSRMVSIDNRDLAWLRDRATVPDPNTHNWYSFMGGIGRYHRGGNVRTVGDTRYVSWAWFWNNSW